MEGLKHRYITVNDEDGTVDRIGIILVDHGEGRLTVEWMQYYDTLNFIDSGREPDTKTVVFEQCEDFDLVWQDDYDLHYTWYTAAGRFVESEKEKGRQQMRINGNQYPVTGYAESEILNMVVPVVDMPLMSDERWRELTETPENMKRVKEMGNNFDFNGRANDKKSVECSSKIRLPKEGMNREVL